MLRHYNHTLVNTLPTLEDMILAIHIFPTVIKLQFTSFTINIHFTYQYPLFFLLRLHEV